MKRRILSLALALALALGLAVPSLAASTFSDVPAGNWAYPYIEQAAARGFVTGVGNGRFNPGGNVTYAEFSAMLVAAFYKDDLAAYTGSKSPWYLPYTATALNNGVFGNTKYVLGEKGPNDNLNRYEMAVMMYNVLDRAGVHAGAPEILSASNNTPDIEKFPYSYLGFVPHVIALGCLSGVDSAGTFNGNGLMTRAQSAAVMLKLDELISGAAPVTPSTPDPAPQTPTVNSDMEFKLRDGETVQRMMNRINAATPKYRKGYLTNGKPITDENILEMLEEVKKNFPTETIWDESTKYYYATTFFYGYSNTGGCNSFAAAVSDYIFGEDAPIVRHFNYDNIKIGDVLQVEDSSSGYSHAMFVRTLPNSATRVFACSGNNHGDGAAFVVWDTSVKISNLKKPECSASEVYSRY